MAIVLGYCYSYFPKRSIYRMSKKYRSRDYHGYLETLKTLPTLQAKWEYTWDNWSALIVGAALVIFFIVTMGVSIYQNSAPIYISGHCVNVVSSEDVIGYEADYLERAFLREYLGIPESDRTVISFSDNTLLDVSNDDAITTTYEMLNALDAYMAAHEIGYFVLPESLVNFFEQRYDAYVDLSTLLTPEEMEQYAERIYYTETGVPAAIDITGTEFSTKMGLVSSEPIHIAFCVYVEDVTHIRSFFDFVMGSVT